MFTNSFAANCNSFLNTLRAHCVYACNTDRKLKVRRDPSNVAAGIVEVKHNTPVPSWRNLLRGGAVMMDAHSLEAGTVHLALKAKASGKNTKKSGKGADVSHSDGNDVRTFVEVSKDQLYAVAATMMDLRQGGCRCLGVTLLPPGGWFLHMAFLTFGLFAPKELVKASNVTREQRTEAKAFDESCALLGEALIYQPHLTSWLLDLFHLPCAEATMQSFGYGSPRNQTFEILKPAVNLYQEVQTGSSFTTPFYHEADDEEEIVYEQNQAADLPDDSASFYDGEFDNDSDDMNSMDYEIREIAKMDEVDDDHGIDDEDDDDDDEDDDGQLFSQYSQMSRRRQDDADDQLFSQYSRMNRRRQGPVANADSDWETDDDEEDGEEGEEGDGEEDEDEEEDDEEDEDDDGVENDDNNDDDESMSATENDLLVEPNGAFNLENEDDDDVDASDGLSSYEDGEFDEESGDEQSGIESSSVDRANIPWTLRHAESLLPAILAHLGDPGDVVWPYQIFHALSQRISKKELKVALDTFKRPPNTPHCPSRGGLAWLLSLKWIKLESYITRDTGAVQWVAFVPPKDAQHVP